MNEQERKALRKEINRLRRQNYDPDVVMEKLNKFLGGHGVEPLRADAQVDRYYYNIVALYVNMGDAYDTTVVYDTDRGTYNIASYGWWVEAQERSGRYRFE